MPLRLASCPATWTLEVVVPSGHWKNFITLLCSTALFPNVSLKGRFDAVSMSFLRTRDKRKRRVSAEDVLHPARQSQTMQRALVEVMRVDRADADQQKSR
jgi:hypothetical protein